MTNDVHQYFILKSVSDFTFAIHLDILYAYMCIIEPSHDKTNKMSVRPAKTQISLGIRPV